MNFSLATNYLSKRNLNKLNKAGVFVVGTQALPNATTGEWINGETALVLSKNDKGYVRDWKAVYDAVTSGSIDGLFA